MWSSNSATKRNLRPNWMLISRRKMNLTTKRMLLKSTSNKKSKKMRKKLKWTTGRRRWLLTKLISGRKTRTKKRHLKTRLALIKLSRTMPQVMATTLRSTWKRSNSRLYKKKILCKKKLTPMAMTSPLPTRLLLQMKRSKSRIRRKRLK